MRDRRTVERWDADGRCQYQTEHDIGVVVVVSRMGDEYRCRGESGGARDAPQLIMRTNADGTHSWDLGAWGVEHWQRVTEPEEPGEGSGGSLRKVEVGRVMSWYNYRARAKQEGGRLPTTAELRAAGVDVGYDQWTPITPSPGDQETGRRDGARGKDENAWANIPAYQRPWGLDASEHPWKRLTYFYVVVSASGGSTTVLGGWAGGGAAASGGLREALDGAPRLKLVAAGSDDALHFDNAATLRAGGEAPLTANGKNVGLYWSQPRNAWGHWDYIDLGVSEKLRPLRVKLDGPFIVWNGPHGEFVFDVSMWQLHEGQHLVLVQACEGNPGGPTRMSQDAAGRDFVLYADGTIGPRTATHLRLGVVSTIGNLRPGWSAHEDIDMAYQGDVEIIHNWREEHSIEDLQRLVERKGYSAISVGSFDHAALKKFPYQLTAGHCEPSPGYSNTLYIWDGRGGGGGFEDDESGALGITSSVQPRIIDSRLVLVRRGSPNVLRFDHWQALQAGGAAPLTCDASHPRNGIGKMYPEERRFEDWRYTESKCVAARDACSVQLVQGKFLKRVDANLVLDVAFWKFHEGTAVNWVGGGSDDRTYLHGGGRDFRVNSDGSICLVNHPLGVIDFESQARLFRWRRWLSLGPSPLATTHTKHSRTWANAEEVISTKTSARSLTSVSVGAGARISTSPEKRRIALRCIKRRWNAPARAQILTATSTSSRPRGRRGVHARRARGLARLEVRLLPTRVRVRRRRLLPAVRLLPLQVQGGTAQLRLSGHRIQLAARPWRLAYCAREPLLGRDPRPHGCRSSRNRRRRVLLDSRRHNRLQVHKMVCRRCSAD